MKINELVNEAFWSRNPAEEKLNDYLKGFMEKWSEYMTTAKATGQDFRDPAYRLKVLNLMINYYTKPKPEDLAVLTPKINSLGKNILKDGNVKEIARQAIALAMQKKLLPQEKSKNAKEQVKRKYNGVDYTWDGKQWVGAATGRVANDNIQAKLNAMTPSNNANPAATNSSTPPDGAIVTYGPSQYKWVNDAWRDIKTGEVLTGDDAEAATYTFRNPE